MDNNISKTIGNRINTLLAEQGVKQKELAQHLQVPDNTISYFVKGTRIPNTTQIIKIAQFFGVSSDYLLGLSNAESTNKDIQFISKYTNLSDKAIVTLNRYKAESNHQTPPNNTQIINHLLECDALFVIGLYIGEYCCNTKKLKQSTLDFLNGTMQNEDKLADVEDCCESARDARDLALFRAQESFKSFVKSFCEDDLQKIKEYNIKIKELEAQLYKKR